VDTLPMIGPGGISMKIYKSNSLANGLFFPW
jgi:hypothetical protein